MVAWTVPGAQARSSALAPSQPVTYRQGSGGVLGSASTNDRFGAVVALESRVDTKLGELTQLTVGIPDEDVNVAGQPSKDAGAVAVLTFAGSRLIGNELLWQGGGLPGRSQAGDRLGASVTYRRGFAAFGVPGKDADGVRDSGAVIVSDGASHSVITQDTPGVPDKSERGDAFGAAVAICESGNDDADMSLAVGASGEDVGRRRKIGALTYVALGGPATANNVQRAQAARRRTTGRRPVRCLPVDCGWVE